jgi:ubiquinone biosynthesis O-methyltransferase
MNNEIKFQKYKLRGVDYHWKQISTSLRKRNLFVVARYQMIVDLIAEEIKNKKILDVGCGDGVLSYFLAKKGGDVTGIDISEKAIGFAKEKCKDINNLEFKVASVYKLPFSDETFDYVVSSEVIEHIAEPEKMLRGIKRVWNKKGKVIITTPIRYTKKPLDKMHYQEFFEEDFRKILEENFKGYKVEIIKSHPLFWLELYNKTLFGKSWFRIIMNFLNMLFGFNPFRIKKNNNWKYFLLEIAIIKK